MDLKNLKLEDIKASLLKLADKKTLIKIGISAGSIIVFLIIYYAILNPIVNKKKAQLTTMLEKQEETAKFISEIKSKKKKIKKLTPQYEKYSTLFHSKAEVEGLYESLSYYAGLNNLVISKIESICDSSGGLVILSISGYFNLTFILLVSFITSV